MKINRRKNDGLLVAAVTVLLTIGLIMVFSASAVVAEEKYGSLLYYSRQTNTLGISMHINHIYLFQGKIYKLPKKRITLNSAFWLLLSYSSDYSSGAMLSMEHNDGIVWVLPVFNPPNSQKLPSSFILLIFFHAKVKSFETGKKDCYLIF